MKKIILSIFFIITLLWTWVSYAEKCKYDPVNWLDFNLDNCLDDSDNLVQSANESDLWIEWWFKESILKWVKNLSVFLSVMAVWSIVYWAFMLTISTWEEEKIKSWKDIVKWWILWFLAVVSAGWIIALVINLVYSLG